MTEKEIEKIADKADFVVSGYAFTERDDGFISILNLNHPECAMVVNKNNEIIDTNMEEIFSKIDEQYCDYCDMVW